MSKPVSNPLAPEQALNHPLEGEQLEEAHTPHLILPEDSAVTKAEKVERNGENIERHELDPEGPAAKRAKLGHPELESSSLAQFKAGPETEAVKTDRREKVKGIALVKPE
jgi:tRNA-dihydrouridine synthase 3